MCRPGKTVNHRPGPGEALADEMCRRDWGGAPSTRSVPTAGPPRVQPQKQTAERCASRKRSSTCQVTTPTMQVGERFGSGSRQLKKAHRCNFPSTELHCENPDPLVQSSHLHHKLSSRMWVRENRCGGEQYLEVGEGGLSLLVPDEGSECDEESSHWRRHLALI